MKVTLINASPRKTHNTAQLLLSAEKGARLAGAETELIHLRDLTFSGCMSCFTCKLKGGKNNGTCSIKDDLSPVLERCMKSDAIIFGSPMYVGDVTSLLRAFLERFFFMNISYDNPSHSSFTGKISGAFIYTMNVPPEMAEMYTYIYEMNDQLMQRLNGKTEYLTVGDTYQFTDYAKYDAANFDETHKAKVLEEQFPVDLNKAFELGKRFGSE